MPCGVVIREVLMQTTWLKVCRRGGVSSAASRQRSNLGQTFLKGKAQTEKGGWWVRGTLRRREQGTESRKRRVGGDVREGRESGTEKAEASRSSTILASTQG